MTNGAAVALAVVLEPPSAPVPPAAYGKIGDLVGATIVDVAVLLGAAALVGGLTTASRESCGDLFVKLYELKTTHPEVDFIAEGKKALRQRLGAELAQVAGDNEASIDAALTEIIGWPVDILSKVVATERAWAN
jgi:hypothetical protein